MAEYTPTIDEVRSAWWLFRAKADGLSLRESGVEFDRWLSAHDREVAANERKAIASELMRIADRMNGEGTQAGYYAAAYVVRERERGDA